MSNTEDFKNDIIATNSSDNVSIEIKYLSNIETADLDKYDKYKLIHLKVKFAYYIIGWITLSLIFQALVVVLIACFTHIKTNLLEYRVLLYEIFVFNFGQIITLSTYPLTRLFKKDV